VSRRHPEDLDDATLDVTDVRVVGATVTLHGHVDEPVVGVGLARLPVTLTVASARSVTVEDGTGTGELVLEGIRTEDTGVVLDGVVPCRVRIETSGPSDVLLEVSEVPIAVRRWGRWQQTGRLLPWQGQDGQDPDS
jgi:hypothetical protein